MRTCVLLVCSILMWVGGCAHLKAERKGVEGKETFMVSPIGFVQKKDGRTSIVLEKRYEPGLMGLEQFSHVTVVYWFHLNDTPQKRAILQVHPQGNEANPMRGVFATHSPVRPNLIAISCCKILSVHANIIEIDGIDAFDGTPVLDLKN